MEFLLIIPIGFYMLFVIPAFMFTWEGLSDLHYDPGYFFHIGCFGWVCMIIGFPGAMIALFIKGIIKLFKLPGEMKEKQEREERERQNAIEQGKRAEQAKREEIAYQKSLAEKRDRIYPNSPVTKEIVEIITKGNELPYRIELDYNGLNFLFENKKQAYVFRSHGLPGMDRNEQTIFANVLNQKLNGRYSISENTKYNSFTHSDGTVDGYTTHVGTIMELKVTRTF